MKALIIYESMYGDAREIARAIGEGLEASMTVEFVEVGAAPKVIPANVDLLIVGGPTHQFGMTRPGSRAQAAKDAGDEGVISTTIGVREWLDEALPGANTIRAAAFATRLGKPRFLRYLGSTARAIEKGLRQQGFQIAAPAESFFVMGAHGPLKEGERERARTWGAEIGKLVGAPAFAPLRA